MKYTFDEVLDYTGFENAKHERLKELFGSDDVIPMWVAEMDFRCCDKILQRMSERVEHGVFGYPAQSDSYKDAVQTWYRKRHGTEIEIENINFHAGVINGIGVILQTFLKPHTKVLIDDPVYHYFAYVLKQMQYEVVTTKLYVEGEQFERDFSDFEAKLQEVDAYLFCSPHNPGGKIWSKEDVVQISTLCKKYDVLLISDEIHSDILMPQQTMTSMLEVSDDAIVISAASKTFNLAGMQFAFSICNNRERAKRIALFCARHKYSNSNTLAMISLRAAFLEGEEWLDQVNAYIYENFLVAKEIFQRKLDKAMVFDLQASYLAWIDVSAYVDSHEQLKETLIFKAKVAPSFGNEFGEDTYGCIRLNLATQKATVIKAVNAICDSLNTI